jgi:signal transduction histidine kinase
MTGNPEVTFSRFLGGLPRRCPEVGFGEIAIDFLQARLGQLPVGRQCFLNPFGVSAVLLRALVSVLPQVIALSSDMELKGEKLRMSNEQSGYGIGVRREKSDARDWLVGGGEMGKLIRSMDWSKTPLGPIESWPQSLRTTVSLCLSSNFPIALAWGPQHVQIYNDGYWPICGEKHPGAMGQDFTECWAAPWPVIGEAFTRALAGETSFLENQRMFLDRKGYLEETFFTFSFSPIRDDSGVAGLFHPVTETTSRMLSERRTRALRDLAARAGKAQTTEEAFVLAAQTLSEYQLDLPFAFFYLFDSRATEARLIASTGLPQKIPAGAAIVDLGSPDHSAWPLAEVAHNGRAQDVEDLETRFGELSCGEYPESVKRALVLPITPPGCDLPVGVLIAGVSPRLALNETYRAFFDLLAAAVTTEVANARAYEEERKRGEALAEIDRAKTAFFSNVSHEFRTPLTLMLGPLEDELAECISPLPTARRERLETAHRNSLRLLKLVNTLLDFSRIEAGRTQASYESTDLAAYTAELASVFRSAVEKAGLTLVVDCPVLPEPVYVDREMWEKIVLNLLSNAFKHTFEGSITVRLRWFGDYAELAVADTGVGIPQTELPRLFERFHRVKGAKSRTHEGTGIGLALVQELVSLHGGQVCIESEEEKGSTFTVTVKTGTSHIPPDRVGTTRALASTATGAAAFVEEALHWLPNAGPDPSSSSPVDCASLPAEATASCADRRPLVIWADDNADMRDYVRRLLAHRYDVLAVPDGLTALAAAQEKHPDLVLTDIMMPGLDGFGLLRALRADARTRTLPVILLSARAGEEAAVEGLDAGADDYLAKPFSAQELLARVRTHLELARVRREWANELEQANNELEAFSYSVSHDLRAPLRAIHGFSALLLEEYADGLDPQATNYIQRIRTGILKMSSLIDDLLKLSKISRTALRKEPINLTDLARGVVADLQNREPAREVAVKIPDGICARGDAALMTIVLTNLLGNAWKYSSKQAAARIEFGDITKGMEPVFYIRDNGAGFDMAQAGKLFAPFQRLHRDSEFEGTGIGLATVQRIITRHGGRIWAEAEPEAGATFFFTLGQLSL